MRRYNDQIGLDCRCSTLLRLGKYCSLWHSAKIARDVEYRRRTEDVLSKDKKRRSNYFSSTLSVPLRLAIQLLQLRLDHFPLRWGGGGNGFEAIGTQPIAAARAKGNQAATDAIFHFGSFNFQCYLANCRAADWLWGSDCSRVLFCRPILDLQYCISKNLTNCIDLIVFDIFLRTEEGHKSYY